MRTHIEQHEDTYIVYEDTYIVYEDTYLVVWTHIVVCKAS